MDKILVEVYIPAAEKYFDVFLPESLKVHEATALMAKLLNELSDGMYVFNQSTVMCDKKSGNPYDVNQIVKQTGLVNGSQIMLI